MNKILTCLASLSLALLTACGGGGSASDTKSAPQGSASDSVDVAGYGNSAFNATSYQAIVSDAASLRYVGKATFVSRAASPANQSLVLDSYEISSPTGQPVPAVRLPLSTGYHFAVAAIHNTTGSTWRVDIETNAPAGTAEVYAFAKGAAGASMAVRSAVTLPAFASSNSEAQAAMTSGAVWQTQAFAATTADGVVAYTPGGFIVSDSSSGKFLAFDLHVSFDLASIARVTGSVQDSNGGGGAYNTVAPVAVAAGGVVVVDLTPYIQAN
ncbi:hypothetical protein DBR42_00900 [Pelomonas sp. HMWF004]|nr:hypothetical protein DBR42_00900 [Pelomonas sp. HMWF004]